MRAALSGSITVSKVDELGNARKAVGSAASASFAPDRVLDIQLVVSELVTNALEHGVDHRADVTFGLVGEEFAVCVTSRSDVGEPPSPTKVANHVPAGRGLTIVETLADRVSFSASDNGYVSVDCTFVVDGSA